MVTVVRSCVLKNEPHTKTDQKDKLKVRLDSKRDIETQWFNEQRAN